MTDDSRLAAAHHWATRVLGQPVPPPEPVSGDASFRRYLRVHAPAGTCILMDAPPDKEDCHPFVAIARHWHGAGIPVPRVLDWDREQGFMLLEDFGNETFARAVGTAVPDANQAEAARRFYEPALDILLRIQQQTSPPDYPLPPFDAGRVRDEISLFTDWLMTRKLKLTPDARTQRQLRDVFRKLEQVFLGQPQVTVHRDYHSRNLMLRDPLPGVLDFQDAVTGPVTYDLVSLLRDCYIRWPEDWVTARADEVYDLLSRKHRPASRETFHRDLDWTGIQRHLKAAGIFARLALRDHKPRYLNDIPRTLSYIVSVGERHPELAPLVRWVRDHVLPAIEETLAA
ncbi:phosphotransferase [Hahella sp. SMD15-11]|uniref:Phosphotransferase n=1 Tax=Thermohahella caldifontis TaxID=3142973 RepID=A0AB39UUM8_9GAMM